MERPDVDRYERFYRPRSNPKEALMVAFQITTVEWAIGIGVIAAIAFALAIVTGRRSRGVTRFQL